MRGSRSWRRSFGVVTSDMQPRRLGSRPGASAALRDQLAATAAVLQLSNGERDDTREQQSATTEILRVIAMNHPGIAEGRMDVSLKTSPPSKGPANILR